MKHAVLALALVCGCTNTLDNAGGGDDGTGSDPGSGSGSGSSGGTAPAGVVFGAYKDTSINMDWNANVISTSVSGTRTPLADDLANAGGKVVTLAFVTGECGSENWGGVQGAAMATANASALGAKGVDYILSTGGAAGSFTCGSDAGMMTFLARWASPHLIGLDFDIEAGQSPEVIGNLVARISAAHAAYPSLRFSLTLATLANNTGGATAQSLGASAPDSFNTYGDTTMAAMHTEFDTTWPSFVTIDLMTMDYGSPGPGVYIISNAKCDMGQSALQAAYNLHKHKNKPKQNNKHTPKNNNNNNTGKAV